jgi:hypothetical protein
MVLGLGAYNLSKNNFFVKEIKAVETLGNATVIVTDKTGTIICVPGYHFWYSWSIGLMRKLYTSMLLSRSMWIFD